MKTKRQKSIERQAFDFLISTPVGTLMDTLITFEKLLRSVDDDEEVCARADSIHKVCDKLGATLDESKERDMWIDALFDLYDTILSRDELETVFWSLKAYSDLLFDESKERKGRAKDKYLDRSGEVTEVFNLLYFYVYKLEGDGVYYDTLTKVFYDTVELFKDDTDEENAKIRKHLNQVSALIKSYDKKMPFDDYLFALCDSLEPDVRQTFYEGVLKGSIEYLTYEFADLENEYAGLDVDLSPQEKRLAALHQMRRKVQKHYNLKRW